MSRELSAPALQLHLVWGGTPAWLSKAVLLPVFSHLWAHPNTRWPSRQRREASVSQQLDRNTYWLRNVKMAHCCNEPDQGGGTPSWCLSWCLIRASPQLAEGHLWVRGGVLSSLPSVDCSKIVSMHLQSIRPHLNNESLIINQKLIQGWRATRWLNTKLEGFLRLAVHAGHDRTSYEQNEMSLTTSAGSENTQWTVILQVSRRSFGYDHQSRRLDQMTNADS